MALHKTNSLLKYIVIPTIGVLFLVLILSIHHQGKTPTTKDVMKDQPIKNVASNDSAAESLDTLTADLSKTKQKITTVSQDNEVLKQQNTSLLAQINSKHDDEWSRFSGELQQIKNQINEMSTGEKSEAVSAVSSVQPLGIIDDLTQPPKDHPILGILNNENGSVTHDGPEQSKREAIPYYTIPANGTSVRDKLMTALVGRIPVKGVVTDPYPFKIVISDDNLAANGLRIPHLLQMIVSGYCEGDLNLVSVRGWVTSLTFVFEDGTISSTTSNENDIGNFTKANSLGYLSDKFGNPFIRGRLITNAPTYLAGNVALSAGTGAASAYAQSQMTNNSSSLENTMSVTGSQGKYIAGQALSGAANEAQQWWHDREEQSFDAVYVAPVDDNDNYVEIAVNFAKEIHIDYDPQGRKLNYANSDYSHVAHNLD